MSRFTRLRNSVLKSAKGVQATAVAVTATSDGTGTGTIPAGTSFVTVTSANADYIVKLPAPVIGTVIYLRNGATGYELRSSSPSTVAINGGTDTAAESAIGANVLVKCVCDTATSWIAIQWSTAGTQTTSEVAAN